MLAIIHNNNLTYGTDPETFAVYKDHDLDFAMPPVAFMKDLGVLPVDPDSANKGKHRIFIKENEFNLMQDGAAFEWNYNYPFHSATEMYNTVQMSVGVAKDFFGKYGYDIYNKPVVNFDVNKFWHSRHNDKDFREGVIFGCDADEDACLTDYQCKEIDVSTHTLRYGGGHIHISSRDKDEIHLMKDNRIPFVMLLTIYLGNTGIKNSPYPELDKIRANTYGRAGRYRTPPHGIEYRALSNGWLNLGLDAYEEMIDMVNRAFHALNHNFISIIENHLENTITAINTANVELSKSVLAQL